MKTIILAAALASVSALSVAQTASAANSNGNTPACVDGFEVARGDAGSYAVY